MLVVTGAALLGAHNSKLCTVKDAGAVHTIDFLLHDPSVMAAISDEYLLLSIEELVVKMIVQ